MTQLNIKILFLFDDYGNFCNGIYERYKHLRSLKKNQIKKLNLKNLFIKKKRNFFFNYFLELIERNKISTLVFTNAPWSYLNIQQIQILKNKFKIIFIVDDCEEYFEWFQLPFAKYTDMVLCHDYKDKKLFTENNILCNFFPQPSLLTNIINKKYNSINKRKFDIFFLGRSDRPGRVPQKYDFSQITNSVYFKFTNLEKIKISNHEKLSIMQDSKIHINFSSSSFNNSYFSIYKKNKRSNNLKGRVYEAVLTDSIVVTEISPGLDEIFYLPNSLFTFRNDDEMYDIIRGILKGEIDTNKTIENSKKCILPFFELEYYEELFFKIKKSENTIINIKNSFYYKFLKVYIAKESLKFFYYFIKKLDLSSSIYELKNFFYYLNFHFFVYIYYYLKTKILS